MSLLTMIQKSGNVVTRRVSAAAFQWMLAVSNTVDTLVSGGAALEAQVRYVTVDGNDTTGTGSRTAPFLTVARAMTSITDADPITKPYQVRVGPGAFATAFTIKSGVYVAGSGSGAGSYNGSPLTGVTYLAPTAAQVLDASFAGAGNESGGISHCALTTNLVANFSAIGSTGNGTFYVHDVISLSDVAFTGGNVLNTVTIDGLYLNASVADLTFTNMGGSFTSNFRSDYGGALAYSQSTAIQSAHTLDGCFCAGAFSLTHTSALVTNSLNVFSSSRIGAVNPVLTGVGAQFLCDMPRDILMSDAANRLSFGNVAAATLLGINGGNNLLRCTPTANRVLTIDPPILSILTRIRVQNLATNPLFNIDLSLQGGAIAVGSPTYVPAGTQVQIEYDVPAALWTVRPYVQSGTVTLSNGVSALIPCDIATTVGADIVASLRDINAGTLGAMVSAKLAGRVAGPRAGGGGFVLTSVSIAGATVATDQGIYDWHVNNG